MRQAERTEENGISISKQNIFPECGHLNAFLLQWCTIYFFVLQTVQSNSPAVLMQADSMPEICGVAELSRQTGLRCPTTGRWTWLWLQTWTNPSPQHSAVPIPHSQAPLWEGPGWSQWPPLLQVNTFAPCSDLACACGGRSLGSSTALSEAHLWVSSVPFLGTAGAGRGTDFTHTGTAFPTWQLALPWPTSTTMGTHAHQAWVLQFSASLAGELAY